MSDHTPGPWRVGRGGTVVCDAEHDGNHRMKDDDLSFYDGHLLAESIARAADARLMAAAPELLRAARMMLDVLDQESFEPEDLGEVSHYLRSAINKAKGE